MGKSDLQLKLKVAMNK